MTETITSSTIETNSYLNVFDTINNRTNVSDPRDNSGLSRRPFVYDYDPFDVAIDFKQMPYISVFPPLIDNVNMTVSSTRKSLLFTFRIVVRTVRQGSSNFQTDIGRKDLLSIGDDLNETFNLVTNKETLSCLKMNKVKLTKISTDFIVIDQNQAYENVYELSFESTKLTVSS